jgi:hypothetical protein
MCNWIHERTGTLEVGSSNALCGTSIQQLYTIEISLPSIVFMWIGFAFHLSCIFAAVCWHKTIGGVGQYGGDAYGTDKE